MKPMRQMMLLVGLAAALAGCSQSSGRRGAETVSGPLAAPVTSAAVQAERCPRMDPRILGEANSETPAAVLSDGGSPALAAALMASEARKNARLREAVAAYDDCREKQKAPPDRRGPVS